MNTNKRHIFAGAALALILLASCAGTATDRSSVTTTSTTGSNTATTVTHIDRQKKAQNKPLADADKSRDPMVKQAEDQLDAAERIMDSQK